MSKIVERTLDFFELFARCKRPLRLAEIAASLDLPASSCLDVVKALSERGYLYEVAPRGGYYPTLRLLDIARTASEHDALIARAEPILQRLRDDLNESVALSKSAGAGCVVLLAFDSGMPLSVKLDLGFRPQSPRDTSLGKARLAGLTPDAFAAALDAMAPDDGAGEAPTSRAALLREIEQGRRRGWFGDLEDSRDGVASLSAPFLWNGTAYVVSVAGPKARLAARWSAAATAVVKSSAELSRQMARAPWSGTLQDRG
jgi:DNA-binding IclR family transcriptional regulator